MQRLRAGAARSAGILFMEKDFCGVVMSLFVLELVSDFWVVKALEIDLLWICLLTSTLMGYIVVRSVHQRTAWLKS